MNTTETEVAEKNELAVIVDGLEKETQQTLLENFTPLLDQAKEWKARAEKLVVTDATQLTEMKQAREARLALKDIRVNADKVRKNLKEDALRYGKAVQGVYNVIEYLIVPIEKHLQEQEDFAKIAEEKRKEALKAERIELLSPYGIQTDFYDLKNMPEPDFKQLLSNTIKNHEERIAAARKEEEERIAREQAELKERERIRLENIALREAADKIKREVAAKNISRNERNAILRKYNYSHHSDVSELSESEFAQLSREAEAYFNETEKKRIEAEQAEAEARERREEELRLEREEKLRLENELREKNEKEERERREAEEKIEAEASMGDKAKFQKLIDEMEALKGKYSFRSKKYKALGESVDELLNKTINWAISKQ